jgi:hypothetical protein
MSSLDARKTSPRAAAALAIGILAGFFVLALLFGRVPDMKSGAGFSPTALSGQAADATKVAYHDQEQT